MTVVETERLLLRPWTEADAEPLAVLYAERRFWHFPFGRGLSQVIPRTFLLPAAGKT